MFTISFGTAVKARVIANALTGGTAPTAQLVAFFDGQATPEIYADNLSYGYPNIRDYHYTGGVNNSIRSSAMQTRDQKTQLTAIAGAWLAASISASGTTVFTIADSINVTVRALGFSRLPCVVRAHPAILLRVTSSLSRCRAQRVR